MHARQLPILWASHNNKRETKVSLKDAILGGTMLTCESVTHTRSSPSSYMYPNGYLDSQRSRVRRWVSLDVRTSSAVSCGFLTASLPSNKQKLNETYQYQNNYIQYITAVSVIPVPTNSSWTSGPPSSSNSVTVIAFATWWLRPPPAHALLLSVEIQY